MTKFMFLISLLFLGILLSAGDKLDGKNPSRRSGRRTPPRPTQPPPSPPPRQTQPPPSPPPRPTQSPPPPPPPRPTQSPPPPPTQPPPLATPPRPTPSPSRPTQPPPSLPPRPTQSPPPPPPRPTQPPPSPPTQLPPLATPPRPTPSPNRPTQPPPSPPPRPTQSPPSPPPRPTQPPPLVTPTRPTPLPPSPSHPSTLPYYVLSLTWPNTFCRYNPCYPRRPPQKFTIHGLWPQRKNCPIGLLPPIDYDTDILPLRKDLLSYWPNLKNAKYGKSFWLHEWNEHGMCSGMSPTTYFRETMDLLKNFNPLPMLESKGVRANGGSYTKADILSALQDGLGNHLADITCVKDAGGNYQLSEVHICFRKNKLLMNCQTSISCGTKDWIKNVIFP